MTQLKRKRLRGMPSGPKLRFCLGRSFFWRLGATTALVFLFLAYAGVGTGSSADAVGLAEKKNVVILSSYGPEFYFQSRFANGFKSEIIAKRQWNVEYSFENLETQALSQDGSYLERLADFLQYKYAAPPDLVIAYGKRAADFMRQYGHVAFGNAPAVLAISADEDFSREKLPEGYVGLTAPVDVTKTVELIADNHPRIEKLYIFLGDSEAERDVRADISRQLADFPRPLEFVFLSELEYPQMLETVSRLEPQKSAVLFFFMFKDVAGRTFTPIEAVHDIRKLSPVPLYGHTDAYLGAGCVGGFMYSYETFGQRAAQIAAEILQGRRGDKLPYEVYQASAYRLDWRELERWGIKEAVLPAGSVVAFRQPAFWDRYKGYVLGGALLLLLQLALIVGLAVSRAKLKKAERDLARIDCLHLVGELAASIGHEVRNPMTTVRGYLQYMLMREEFSKTVPIQLMIEELDRANLIISEFLSLAKGKQAEKKLQDINGIVDSILPLLYSEALFQGHELVFEPGDVPQVLLGKEEIRQVILNLAKNGLEAMEKKGKLTIRTWSQENGRAVLSVTDQGQGITEKAALQVGKPFFTTKEHGIGLGLSVCFAIADRHGGQLTFETSPDGTTFNLSFPVQ